jgi:hypothetical protein
VTRLHAAAGTLAFVTLVSFWVATLSSELLGAPSVLAAKSYVLVGMLWLVPALVTAGWTGSVLATGRKGPRVRAKMRRMPVVALNGLLVLLPSALCLRGMAADGVLGSSFVALQALELAAGALNLGLLGASLRDGLMLTGRLRRRAVERAP